MYGDAKKGSQGGVTSATADAEDPNRNPTAKNKITQLDNERGVFIFVSPFLRIVGWLQAIATGLTPKPLQFAGKD